METSWWRRRPGSAPTAPPHRPPRDRGRRTRPEDRRRPRERAHPHRGASRPREVLTDPARQRRRHHHRTLHHPRPGRGDARQGHRRDDRTPTDARPGSQQDRSFDWRHRRGLAFAELLEHLPTDHLHTKSAATVVVTIDHTVLAGAMKAAHLDTDQALSAGEARRLACTAGILPAVLGTKSVALDLGRESRLFSEAQRVAKGLDTPPAPPPAANAPTPGASSTTDNPGPKAAAPTSPTRSRSAPNTTTGSTTPASTTSHARRQRPIQQAHMRPGMPESAARPLSAGCGGTCRSGGR